MKFILNNKLTSEEIEECKRFAKEKTDQKLEDAKTNPKAGCSNGSRGEVRPYPLQLEDNLMGNLAELAASKFLKTTWLKETQQYFTKKPDLQVIFKGKPINCAVRGSRKKEFGLYRVKRDERKPANELLVCVTNVPYGPDCDIVYSTFGEIKAISDAHPEWVTQKHTPSPISWIPISYFYDDFSVFG